MSKPTYSVLITSLALAIAAGAAQAGTIKKCKDENGRWHYGDDAAAACAKSKIIEMNASGTTKKVIDVPPSASDLDEFRKKKEAEAEAKRMAEEQKKHDQVLLNTYSHEDDIIYARDRQMSELENSITSGEQTLKSLRAVLGRMRQQAQEEKEEKGKISDDTKKGLDHSEKQVKLHSENLLKKRQEKEALRQKFEKDLTRYRQLKVEMAPKPGTSGG